MLPSSLRLVDAVYLLTDALVEADVLATDLVEADVLADATRLSRRTCPTPGRAFGRDVLADTDALVRRTAC